MSFHGFMCTSKSFIAPVTRISVSVIVDPSKYTGSTGQTFKKNKNKKSKCFSHKSMELHGGVGRGEESVSRLAAFPVRISSRRSFSHSFLRATRTDR